MNIKEEIEKSKLPILVLFYAPWASPSMNLKPKVEELAEEYKGEVTVIHVNIDDHSELTQEYGVRGIPTMILFAEGGSRQVDEMIGSRPKEAVIEWLTKNGITK